MFTGRDQPSRRSFVPAPPLPGVRRESFARAIGCRLLAMGRSGRTRRGTRCAIASLVALLVIHALPAQAVEYQINFVDGTELRTSRVRQVRGEIQYEKFGGEASVSMDQVASVYIIEADGTVSWVMQPHGEGAPLPRTAAAAPSAKGGAVPAGTAPAPADDTAAALKDQKSTPAVTPTANVVPPKAGQPVAGREQGAHEQEPAAPSAPTVTVAGQTEVSPGPVSPPAPRSGKVILKPTEPLGKRLLRWGAAPLAALIVLGAVLAIFRRKFRVGEQGVPVTVTVGEVGHREADFSTPDKSWETLVAAIEERDIDAYRLCWQQSYSDEDLAVAFQKVLMNWKYYDYSVAQTEPHPNSKERFYLHIKRSTKFAREDLEERVRRVSLLLTDGGWKFEELPFGF